MAVRVGINGFGRIGSLTWYNEWGYSCRMAELARKVAITL